MQLKRTQANVCCYMHKHLANKCVSSCCAICSYFQKKKQKVGVDAFHKIISKVGVIMSSASFVAYSKGYALPLTLHVERTGPEILLLFKSKSVIGSCVRFDFLRVWTVRANQ